MPPGLDSLKHVVILMLENRSFDHMLGSLKAVDPRIDGIANEMSNPDDRVRPCRRNCWLSFRGSSIPTLTTTSRPSIYNFSTETPARTASRT